MNATEYADYQNRVGNFLTANNIKPGCFGPTDHEAEPEFSWHQCGCCGSRLGGNRENYIFARNDNSQFEESICTDCVYFLTYDRLDDLTMMQIEQSEKAEVQS